MRDANEVSTRVRRPGGVARWMKYLGVLLLLGTSRAEAYTFVRVGVDSNILIDGSRIIFAQGTGSLTVLDLETGQVRLRKKPGKTLPYAGRLQSSAHGVLMMSYDSIALLDKNTFDPLWQASGCTHAVGDSEHVVSMDGDHTVTCRRVQSGEKSWSIDMQGGWELIAAKGKVLVATPSYASEPSALRVIDLSSGQTLLRHEAPSDILWLQVYFDGTHIYVLESRSPKEQSYDAKPGKLMTLDLQGKITASVEYDSPEVKSLSRDRYERAFIWRDKYFDARGRVQAVSAPDATALAEFWKRGDRFYESPHGSFIELLPGGVFANTLSPDAGREIGQLLQLKSVDGSWTAYAPHLGEVGKVSQVSQAPGQILIGTDVGHVECLDIKTGRPNWLYVFPTVNQTMSYSVPYGMPPYLADASQAYRDGLAKMSGSRGTIQLGPGFDLATARWSELRDSTDYPGRVIIDPDPDNPFFDLNRYLSYVAACAVTPLIGATALLLRFAWRRASRQAGDPQAERRKPAVLSFVAWCFVLSIPAAAGIMLFGRVSHSWTVALKVVFATAILGVAVGIVRLFVYQRFTAAILAVLALLLWCFLMWQPWWFA